MNGRSSRPGKVYLVGAGPGALGLITVKGLRLLRRADVVVYDELVNPALLKEARRAREVYPVLQDGRRMNQVDINRLLIEKAREYRIVVRLKWGDPFLFGRGGEECEALRHAGVPFEVVPGVSSALAGPAYAGIPATHRHYSSSMAIIPGQEARGKGERPVNYRSIFRAVDTVIVLMGVRALPHIVEEAIRAGLDLRTPVAVVQGGTLPSQRIILGTLRDIVTRAREVKVASPAVIVIGPTAALAHRLQWFGRRVQ